MTVALVTGAAEGSGLEISRELADRDVDVMLAAPDEDRAREAVLGLWEEGLDTVRPRALDATSAASVGRLRDRIDQDFGRLDVLVLVAVGADDALRIAGAFVPLMRREHAGRIITVSSDEAVRAVTRTLAAELEGSGIAVEAAEGGEDAGAGVLRAIAGGGSAG